MTVLTVQAALAVALQCAPTLDPYMLVGVAQHESGLETELVHDNNTGEVLRGPGTLEAATGLIAAGHSVDLGPWQINSRNLGLLGLNLADTFNPCRSAAGAQRLLQLFSAYNTGSPTRGIANGYAMKVVAATDRVKSSSIQAPTLPRTVAIEDGPALGEIFFTTEGH